MADCFTFSVRSETLQKWKRRWFISEADSNKSREGNSMQYFTEICLHLLQEWYRRRYPCNYFIQWEMWPLSTQKNIHMCNYVPTCICFLMFKFLTDKSLASSISFTVHTKIIKVQVLRFLISLHCLLIWRSSMRKKTRVWDEWTELDLWVCWTEQVIVTSSFHAYLHNMTATL